MQTNEVKIWCPKDFGTFSLIQGNHFVVCEFELHHRKEWKRWTSYHYHNAKFFPEVLNRDHDERRLWNNDLDRLLILDRGTFFIVLKDEENNLFATSIQKGEASYAEWEPFAKRQMSTLKNFVLKDSLLINSHASPLVNLEEITEESIQIPQEQRTTSTLEGDPATPLENLFRNQGDFKDFIRKMYDGKCDQTKIFGQGKVWRFGGNSSCHFRRVPYCQPTESWCLEIFMTVSVVFSQILVTE